MTPRRGRRAGASSGSRLRVTLLATELTPLAKTGGLGDAVEGIARSLADRGHAVEVVLPGYGFLRERGHREAPASERNGSSLRPLAVPGFPGRVRLLEHPAFAERRGIYADPETGAEYPGGGTPWGSFARGAIEALAARGEAPDVLHVHDFHPALAPALLRRLGAGGPDFARTATVLTVHNAGYQGIFDSRDLLPIGVPPDALGRDPWEYWGRTNFLKAGAIDADVVTTVSPTYAREIQSDPEFGAGLEGVFRTRPGGVVGILNGIDTATWNPAADPHLPVPFDAADLSGKSRAREALLARTGLATGPGRPLAGMVTRLTPQKGIDLVLDALPGLLDLGVSLAVLGSGDAAVRARVREAADRHPDRVFHSGAFDDPLAHLIQGGADLFFMPSRYEPCGLTQMIAQRYGTVPVARRVGGLADTIRPVPPEGAGGTGYLFEAFTPEAFLEAVGQAVRRFGHPRLWQALMRRGMGEDFSWKPAAAAYEAAYLEALERRRTLSAL